MINILFYGNCQCGAIKETLLLENNKYNINYICCWLTDYDKETFTNIVKDSDIIITQQINDNYRDLDYLSTLYVINNSKDNCKVILFDSCYFDFYYFDSTYKRFNNDVLHKPIDYHYNKMIECYSNDLSIDYYIENYVNNIELKSIEELENIVQNSLNSLKTRYENNKNKYNKQNVHIISIHDFIKQNYKNKLLFYSMNHPTKYLIQYICEEIIEILKIPNTIDYNVDCLNSPKCILYKCIQKNVNFDINEHLPLMLDNNNLYEITKIYYNTYKEIGFISE